jgi:orotidine-5'-phosphate decarboxylase
MDLIEAKRSLVIACDVPTIDKLEWLIKATTDVAGVGAYKVGLQLALKYGLDTLVKSAKAITKLPIIYDHQKGATDIPEVGTKFAQVCKAAGVDCVILFPLSGPQTERAWIQACKSSGLHVLVGAHMTHKAFLSSEGGFILDDAPTRIFEMAADLSVTDFVVPGNKPESVLKLRHFLESKGAQYTFYAPGFIAQGGEISECGRVAGEKWHAIVGSAIYKAADPHSVAKSLTRQII